MLFLVIFFIDVLTFLSQISISGRNKSGNYWFEAVEGKRLVSTHQKLSPPINKSKSFVHENGVFYFHHTTFLFSPLVLSLSLSLITLHNFLSRFSLSVYPFLRFLFISAIHSPLVLPWICFVTVPFELHISLYLPLDFGLLMCWPHLFAELSSYWYILITLGLYTNCDLYHFALTFGTVFFFFLSF